MAHKLEEVLTRFKDVEQLLADRAAEAQSPAYTALLKEHSRLGKFVSKHATLESLRKQIAQARELLADASMTDVAKEELASLEPQEKKLAAEIDAFLEGADRPQVSGLIIEIRPGTGGDEAMLFAGDLVRMYMKFIQRQGWSLTVMDLAETELGGLRSATLSVEGEGAYDRLRYESGTHRVQRVPKTEAQGRIHTSTATVAVLPEAQDIEVKIEEKDLRIDKSSAGGPGGQHVNKTQSGVRVRHLPTGVMVECTEQRNQGANKKRALKILASKLATLEDEKRAKVALDNYQHKSTMGFGANDRHGSVTLQPFTLVKDRRTGWEASNTTAFLDGDMGPCIEAYLTWAASGGKPVASDTD